MHVPEQRVLDIVKILQMQQPKNCHISADGVLIGSTGVIGKQIPIDKLTAGIESTGR